MKYDIVLNGSTYVVEIDEARVRLLQKECAAAAAQPAIDTSNLPDFDFGTEDAVEKQSFCAQLPGTVLAVQVTDGQQISKGEPIFIIESMKMENVVSAEHDCVIEKVLVRKGDYVKKSQQLVLLKALV